MLAIVAAMMLAATSQHDTVYTADGSRFVGTVVEEGSQGVTVQLVDGSYRRLPRREVVRVEYADGSVSAPRRAEPPASPPSAAAPPPTYTPQPPAQPPAYAPPPPPQGYPPPPPAYGPGYPVRRLPPPAWAEQPHRTGPISQFYLSLGIGGLFLSGDAEPGVAVGEVFGNQLDFGIEGGLRLSRHLALALYGDFGVGDPGRDVRTFCNDQAIDCSASTTRVGILLRHTFDPAARVTPWIGVGTGFASGHVTTSSGGGYDTVAKYSGWEMLRLQGGIDVRSSPVLGVGFYGGVSFTRFDEFENSVATLSLGDKTTHTMVEAGIRMTLFP